jgi:tetratricopeptide (TPR) repeat protein
MIRNIPVDFDPESAIIDAELLVKYRMINRAIETLERAIDSAPRHVALREKLLQILIEAGRRDLAAQQCLALASLHISANEIEKANERLLEAKRLDPRVSVTGQLREVRKSDPLPPPVHQVAERSISAVQKVLTGSLSDVSLFDIIQILENSKLSGEMYIISTAARGEIYFKDGLIIGARCGAESAIEALSLIADANDGTFEFEKSGRQHEKTIKATSNTALILDLLRSKDEANFELGTADLFQ